MVWILIVLYCENFVLGLYECVHDVCGKSFLAKEVNSVPYWPVWPVYTVPTSEPIQITLLFRTGKYTDRTGRTDEIRLFWLVMDTG